MADKLEKLPRAETFQEHSADFGNIVPQTVSKDIATILFMITRPIPAIKSVRDENKGTVTVEVAVETELQHSCSVNIHIDQLAALKNNIEEFLANHNA